MTNQELREKIEQLYDYATGISAWNAEDRKPQWIGKLLDLIQSAQGEAVREFVEKILEYRCPAKGWVNGVRVDAIEKLLADYQKGTHAND